MSDGQQGSPEQPRTETRIAPHPAGGGHTSQDPTPPPPQLHRPRGARNRPRPVSEGPAEGQCPHIKSKTPSDEGECVPDVGLEPYSNPRHDREVPENMRNPARSDLSTTQYEAQSVDNVHTPFLTGFERLPRSRTRGAAVLCSSVEIFRPGFRHALPDPSSRSTTWPSSGVPCIHGQHIQD
jgi:hypothetical protein